MSDGWSGGGWCRRWVAAGVEWCGSKPTRDVQIVEIERIVRLIVIGLSDVRGRLGHAVDGARVNLSR